LKSQNIQLTQSNFGNLFPFFIVFDNSLKIITIGPSIQKLLGDLKGNYFGDLFKFIRPTLSIKMEFESMKEHLDTIVIVESIEHPLKTRLRGQFIFEEHSNEIIFINSPWINQITELSYLDLLISDFAIHDTMIDTLQLLHSKELVNNDLIDVNNQFIELSKFPNQNPQPIMRIDFDGKLIYSNAAADILMQKENEGIIKLLFKQFKNKLTSKISETLTINSRYFDCTLIPYKDKNYINIYMHEITDAFEYQSQLANTTARLYTLLESMQASVLAEDLDKEIIFVNQNFCDLFEIPIPAKSMIGLDCSKAAEQSKSLFKNEVEFLRRIDEINGMKQKVFGDILYMKNGKILERDFIPIYENGFYAGNIWKYQDITEIVLNKEKIKLIEDKYSKIIESLKLGLLEVDLDENITKVYPAFSNLTGYTEEEILGKNAFKLFGVKEEKENFIEQNETRKNGIASMYETQIRVKNNEIKWIIISGAPIFNNQNEVVGSIGIHVDITERKKLEQDLILANKQAKASIKSKEMFIANTSHEIRTPMNVIIGMIDVLKETTLTEDQIKYLNAISTSANNLLLLINDVLDFSKIESGNLILDQAAINIVELINNLEIIFNQEIKEKGLRFLCEIDPGIQINLLGDAAKLNQILINLISNAIKFTDKGSVELVCNLVENNENQQVISFEIIDTGIGIKPENFDLIFEIFKQEDASVSRNYGGTGLGLPISKNIVSKMGGNLTVKSEKNVGSNFSFTIPFVKNKQPILENTEQNISLNKTLSNIRILVAEDNVLNQMLIKAILDKENVSFDFAGNGQEVLSLLKKNKYDIILMDIQMPIMDGLTATKIIRTDLKSNIPIIALTANTSFNDEKEYLKNGMNDQLSKPFKRDELLQKISLLISKK
jgi:PAS domain S-box-containing protein